MSTRPPQPHRENRLAGQSSPYLLQHVRNPVDWFPWGPEAFAEARRRDVPIFLSIGYSTCYWCHVMERESFEDAATARAMNDRFVCVKVDREERPDVDDVYMAATQVMTGRGGWPMSVFLEPVSLKPFWCGTYFPPEPRHGMPSFTQVLAGIAGAWKDRRAEVAEQAETLAGAVQEHLAGSRAAATLGPSHVAGAVSSLLTTHDRVRGGFSTAPKFPQPAYLELLREFLPHAGDPESAAAAEAAIRLTLDQMAIGGVFDHVGGGFHRYSVDAHWTVPHFEKMLYDNAQLAGLYARAARRWGDSFFAQTARRTLDFVLREMTSPEGAFFSAQDAEVDGREGLNYLWTPAQVRDAVGGDDAEFALRVYGLDRGTNFRDPHHPEAAPANVPRLDDRPERVATSVGMDPAEFGARLQRVNTLLFAARSRRAQPRLDDKVLCGWNGLMIGAIAAASVALDEPAYRRAAERAADFVLTHMGDDDGGLLRTHRGGLSKIPAFLEDYALFIHGLIELHRAGGDAFGPYLGAANELVRAVQARFGDGAGGFFDTPEGHADLFVRTRTTYDGAIPCGSSVMLNNLIDLSEMQGRHEDLAAAARCLASISGAVAASPIATANATRGLLRLLVIDADVLAATLPAGQPVLPGAAEGEFQPVAVFASVDRVTVRRTEPAALTLRVTIAGGYHITAADPGDGAPALTPLRVGVTGGSGLVVYADYPAGEPIEGPLGRVRVHRGDFQLPVVLERHGEWHGRPMLVVTSQACTETECLMPVTVELDVAIDPAG
ncbi:MAG: DUF255 domain-containing protein [Phycisphaerales bacterium]